MRLLSRLRFSFAAVALSALLAACGGSGTNTSSSSSSGSGGSAGGGTGGTGGVLPPPQSLSVMDWNVRNYFDKILDAPEEGVLSASDYNEKRAGIGAVIQSLSPDIVVLAEVENKFVLDDLNTAVLGGVYVDTEIFDGNDPRGINVGMLSKVKPDKVVSHKDDAFTRNGTNGPTYHYARDCLEVHFTFNGRHMVVLGVHFKAKTAPDDPDKRLAEAQHTRAIADAIMAEDPGAGVIILGDFNDTPGSPPVAAVVGAEPVIFSDATSAVPDGDRYTYDFNGTHELIDHQMANPLAAAMLDPASVVIKHGKAIDDGSKAASDHSPIFARYQVR